MNRILALGFGLALAAAIVFGAELANVNKKLAEVMSQPPRVVEEVRFVEVETICPDCKNDCSQLYLGVDEEYLWVYNQDGEPVAFWERNGWTETTLKE